MKHLLVIVLLSCSLMLSAQDSVQTKALTISGYVKDLQFLTFNKTFEELITGNLIHNRVNVRYKPFEGFSAGVEIRNRLFWGEEVRLTPSFSSGLRYPSESVDLSVSWFETESMVLHTNIDRLWIDYSIRKWNLRLGRQRINWGIGTTWNPNDLFNTFNFLDFDYEERPASDAVKLQYTTGLLSNVELAFARTNHENKNIIAASRFFTNRWNYDFQFLAGWYLDQPTVGTGWSGSVGDMGFKGEVQYFMAHRGVRSQLNASVEADYVFEEGWYLSGGFLMNDRGIDQPLSLWNISVLELSPRNPMPTRWNTVVGVAKEITPLWSVQGSFIYSPQTNLLLVLPSMQYNMATNLDVNLVWQSFFTEQPTGFEALSHRVFLRFKWSF